eukprot:TRINITY_DN42183_c0_g1_i2.p1 TRINITY_DN42183_c0_g1~~TRINITY_DN42183_c0_g1_i2.p1  ORF type:complete len:282 (+),score=56.72 TRINITY_DN42183_c0_g1_i2:29-847(+)
MADGDEVAMEVEAVPLVGPMAPISELKEQYAENEGFLPKVASLEARFSGLRRTRPDGNCCLASQVLWTACVPVLSDNCSGLTTSCFYRAYLFGIFEQLAGSKERHAALTARAKGCLEFCVGAGYEQVAIEDFHEEFLSSLDALGTEGSSASSAEAVLEENDGYFVCWARVLTSAYLKRHEEDYKSFLSSHGSIQQLCAQEVDPMNTEADHLQIAALSSHLGVPVCVVYLDRSEGDTAAEHHFEASSAAGPLAAFQPVYLLYRPGHYDLIYPK